MINPELRLLKVFLFDLKIIVGEGRSISMEMTQHDSNTNKGSRLNAKNTSNLGSSNAYMNNRSSLTGQRNRAQDNSFHEN